MNPSWNFPAVPDTIQIPASSLPGNVEVNTAFVLSHLLPDMMKYLPSSNLLHSCRLVSKLWRDESSSILRRRKTAKCAFEYTFEHRPPHDTFVLRKWCPEAGKWDVNVKTLNELSQLLSCPFQYFPSSWFSFSSGSLNHPEALSFFSLHGSKVAKLTVNNYENSAGFLMQRVFSLTPDLEILEFFTSPWNFHDSIQHQLDLEPDQEQNQKENQNQNHRPLFPRLRSVCWAEEVKIEDSRQLAHVSSVFNLIQNRSKSKSFNPQRFSFLIFSLDLTLYHRREWPRQEQNKIEIISLLKNLSGKLGVKFQSVHLAVFSPLLCPLSLLQALTEPSVNLQTEHFHLENGILRDDYRPPTAHFIGVRIALWRIMENTSALLKSIKCSSQVFNLLTRIPFQVGAFPKLKQFVLYDNSMQKYEQAATLTLKPNAFFRLPCEPSSSSRSSGSDSDSDSNWNSNANYTDFARGFPQCPLWTDLSGVAPCLQIFRLRSTVLSTVEEWVPFLNGGTRSSNNPDPESELTPNSSVKELEIILGWESLCPEILGKLINSFPQVKRLAVEEIRSSVYVPMMDRNNVSTLEQLLSFLFAIGKNPVNRENGKEVKTETSVEVECKSESNCEPSSSSLVSQAEAEVMKFPDYSKTTYWTVAMGDDPTPRTVQKLLNLKKLVELRVSFSLCGLIEEEGQRRRRQSAPFSNVHQPKERFLSRIPNLRHVGVTPHFKSLNIYCSRHRSYCDRDLKIQNV